MFGSHDGIFDSNRISTSIDCNGNTLILFVHLVSLSHCACNELVIAGDIES